MLRHCSANRTLPDRVRVVEAYDDLLDVMKPRVQLYRNAWLEPTYGHIYTDVKFSSCFEWRVNVKYMNHYLQVQLRRCLRRYHRQQRCEASKTAVEEMLEEHNLWPTTPGRGCDRGHGSQQVHPCSRSPAACYPLRERKNLEPLENVTEEEGEIASDVVTV